MVVGALGAGWISYMMSRPMVDGFTSGAAILIIGSQLPGAAGVEVPTEGVLQGALWTLAHPGAWEGASILLGALTVCVIVGGRRIHPLVPGVLIATVVGVAFSVVTAYTGPTVGDIPVGLPRLDVALPWVRLPVLILPGFVIALVGSSEAASISRLYAAKERMPWSPDREFISQGAANMAAGLFGGFPVGGSFARSSLNYLAGARTKWSGAFSGLAVLLFLPFAQILAPAATGDPGGDRHCGGGAADPAPTAGLPLEDVPASVGGGLDHAGVHVVARAPHRTGRRVGDSGGRCGPYLARTEAGRRIVDRRQGCTSQARGCLVVRIGGLPRADGFSALVRGR